MDKVLKRININEIKNDSYIKFYKFLFEGNFMKISGDAKILYCLLRDRMNLSVRNTKEGDSSWVDDKGEVFIYATNKNMMELINCSEPTVIKLKKELLKFKLIEEVRTGLNKTNKIYILNVNYLEDIENSRNLKILSSRTKKSLVQELKKFKPNKTNINKTNNNTTTTENKNLKENELEIISTNKIIEPENVNPKSEESVILTNELQEEIKAKVAKDMDFKRLKGIIKKDNITLEQLRYYLDNWHKVKIRTKSNAAGHFITYLTEKYKIFDDYKTHNKGGEPIQKGNFEQRKYTDEEFDAMYDN